jgi:hypothetical protein
MLNITTMSTAQLASLIRMLREDLDQAKAAENCVLEQDLRRALVNVTAELKARTAPKSAAVMGKRPTALLLQGRAV